MEKYQNQILQFKVKAKPIYNEELEKFCNWLSKCPIPPERVIQKNNY